MSGRMAEQRWFELWAVEKFSDQDVEHRSQRNLKHTKHNHHLQTNSSP